MSVFRSLYGPNSILLMALFAITASPPLATPAFSQSLDLDEIIREVSSSNPSLKVAEAEPAINRSDYSIATSLPAPTLSAAWNPYPIFTARGSLRSRVGISQTVPLPGIRKLRGDIVRLESERLGYRADALRLNLRTRTKLIYDELYRLQELAALVRTFAEDLERFERAALAQYEIGRETLTPVLNIQNERQALYLREKQIEEDRRTALRELFVLMNRSEPSFETALVPERTLSPISMLDSAQLHEVALRTRPELRALMRDRNKANLKVDLARKESRPEFNFGLEFSDIASEGFLTKGDGRNALGIKFGATIPLWSAARKAPMERATLERNQVDSRVDELQTSIEEAIDELISRFSTQQDQVALLESDLIPRSEIARDAALTAYSSDRASFLAVLDAERTLFTFRTQLLDARVRQMQTHALLERELAR